MKNTILILIILLLSTTAVKAKDFTQDQVEGVTEFLIDRANENYLYFFENSIKENGSLDCYFGNTVELLKLGGLKEILLSNGLWKESMDNDYKVIRSMATLWVISKSIDRIESVVDTLVVKIKVALAS